MVPSAAARCRGRRSSGLGGPVARLTQARSSATLARADGAPRRIERMHPGRATAKTHPRCHGQPLAQDRRRSAEGETRVNARPQLRGSHPTSTGRRRTRHSRWFNASIFLRAQESATRLANRRHPRRQLRVPRDPRFFVCAPAGWTRTRRKSQLLCFFAPRLPRIPRLCRLRLCACARASRNEARGHSVACWLAAPRANYTGV